MIYIVQHTYACHGLPVNLRHCNISVSAWDLPTSEGLAADLWFKVCT